MSSYNTVVAVYTYTDALVNLENIKGNFQYDENVNKSVIELQASIAESLAKKLRGPVVDTYGLTVEEKDQLTRPGYAGKIPAIKLIRERLNLGLSEAKTYVENALVNMGYGYWDTFPVSSDRNPGFKINGVYKSY